MDSKEVKHIFQVVEEHVRELENRVRFTIREGEVFFMGKKEASTYAKELFEKRLKEGDYIPYEPLEMVYGMGADPKGKSILKGEIYYSDKDSYTSNVARYLVREIRITVRQVCIIDNAYSFNPREV